MPLAAKANEYGMDYIETCLAYLSTQSPSELNEDTRRALCEIIDQALKLADGDLDDLRSPVKPEAISIAVRLTRDGDLKAKLASGKNPDILIGETAKDLLASFRSVTLS